MAIHFTHRVGAIVASAFVIILVVQLARVQNTAVRRMGAVLLGVLVLQLCLGISNVIFGLPIAVAVAHNVVGALLLLALVTLSHRLFTAQKNE